MRMVGREETLREAAGALTAHRSVLLHGPPGIGKSTLADALADRARADGVHVLRAAPAAVESDLPYLVLIDLFAESVAAARALPTHLREALDVALLRTRGAGAGPDELTVRIAVLEHLRRLAAENPVLLVIDDAQWVDGASADVLAFAARRIGGLPVSILVTERVEDAEPTARALCHDPLAIALEPLDRTAITELLSAETAAHTAQRVYAASGGNPMYAIELARALGRGPAPAEHEPLPVPDRLRDLLARRLDGLGDDTRRALVYAALVSRPTLGLLIRAEALPADGLHAAETARIITATDDGDIAFLHPLLRELVTSDAGCASRRAAHAELAAVVDDPVERARHRALGNPAADADIAALAETAATEAAGRGAPGTAVGLARLSARRTPPENTAAIAARLLTAAGYAQDAGRVPEARELAEAALAAGGAPVTRVRARLLVVDLAWHELGEASGQLARAATEAGADTALQARVGLYEASLAYFERRNTDAARHAHRAEGLAREAGEKALLVEALGVRATIAAPDAPDGETADALHEAAYRMAQGLPVTTAAIDARQMWAMTALFRGDLATARDEIARLEHDVRSRGLIADLMGVLISTTSVNVRAGDGAAALRAGDECERLFLDAAPTPCVGLVVGASAEWCAGTPRRAVERAANAVAVCERLGDDEWLEPALAIHGQALLMTGDAAAAVAAFDRAAELEEAGAARDPAIIPWHADHIEALVATGDLDAAAERLDDLAERVELFGRPVIAVQVERVRALLTAARGDGVEAMNTLRAAIETHGPRAYPLEAARAELTLGRIARRARRRSVARAAFATAVTAFAAVGADAHLAIARDELDRLDHQRADGGDGLAEADRRLVAMVRAGATNREIGAALFLSVKAVEARLSRLYRRFGVRNRAELLHKLAE
ncbi:AAA family ATPase [Phytomonospora endophytica]|uniref:DNA-binding CsgD family transcriptional regulator/DNA polymerase III delta prime subunit n=1 Tax=Phytomonospora endophytica TaxID=714109 RepID=A0A841FA75_9ACTN|nr:helix-turn-helix transcriptional regulator [Phytomonospora endophytica]MBB6034151.1 DNA-binding CsgD family transcriptional regulator/DNA polymerase III delta prime subunit [Phytomonospora endophytica]GIG66543.1 transcriptional regulator [Phytomonospora endophytica]